MSLQDTWKSSRIDSCDDGEEAWLEPNSSLVCSVRQTVQSHNPRFLYDTASAASEHVTAANALHPIRVIGLTAQ